MLDLCAASLWLCSSLQQAIQMELQQLVEEREFRTDSALKNCQLPVVITALPFFENRWRDSDFVLTEMTHFLIGQSTISYFSKRRNGELLLRNALAAGRR